MDTQLMSQLHVWDKVDDLEVIPGDQIEPAMSRTTREVPCLLKPATRESLIEVVSIARERKIRIYPVSLGNNWGYGAHLPVENDCVIVSLEKWKKIGPCDPASGKIYIEPGVSQIELYNYLEEHHPEFTYNVTGAGSDTSIIGNTLERGIGYYRSRAHELHGLEVLTIDGEIIKQDPRLWHPSHPEGIGTGWESLFFQSNFGIVLGGWFTLLPKQESTTFISIRNFDLDTLLDDFKALYRERVLDEIVHIADPGRKIYVMKGLILKTQPNISEEQVEEVLEQFGSKKNFQGLTAIHGRKAIAKSAVREIKKIISPGSTLDAFTPEKVKRIAGLTRKVPIRKIQNVGIFMESIQEILLLSNGHPTNIGHLSITMKGDNPNYADELAVYLNATLPPRENATSELRAMLDDKGYKYSITYIVNKDQAVSAIITLHFEAGESEKVQEALHTLTVALIEHGFPPYRAGIDQMKYLGMPDITRKLKDYFDPQHLIAPGRYT